MPASAKTTKLSSDDLREFLRRTPPFSELDAISLDGVVVRCRVESRPKGDEILNRGRSEVDHLRVIYQGRVRLTLKDESGEITLEDFRGPGESIGHLAILRGSLSNLDVVAVEDTTFLLITKDDLRQLTRSNLGFAQYYLRALSEGYVSKALDSLERPRGSVNSEGSLYLFSAQVGDVVRRRPITIPASESVQRAAGLMSERRVGCLLVTDQSGEVAGIVTDRDLRTKVVAQGGDVGAPVAEIMTAPVQSIPAHTICFDALLEMMRRRVHHLPLKQRGEIVGVISGHDLMVVQGSSPLFLVREIMKARRVETLFDIALKSPRVVRSLIKEGAKAGHITRMITLINDYILERLLTLLQESLGPPPVPFCWLLMGSEGRKEQTFRTDQDNGLIYEDPGSEAERRQAEEYFGQFGRQAVDYLVACGVPRCKGDIMASNPRWRQPYSVWQGYFDRWIRTPEPQEVLHATIFFDFRPGFGEVELGGRLRDFLMKAVDNQDIFLRFLARDCMNTPPALNFFRQFNLEKSGNHKNKLDLKTKGITPFVDFARLMSLWCGVRETNTLERLQLLGEGGFISHELQMQARQAYEFQMQLRLHHQQALDEEALEPDNFIDPEQLSEMDRRSLKDALGVIGDIKGYIKDAFHLGAG